VKDDANSRSPSMMFLMRMPELLQAVAIRPQWQPALREVVSHQ
jgi:hypothetical protein